uniref:TonB-dependent receptor n=1 Tax=Prevotella sp. GTC17254 TaxID=3236794 RepID=A0AB33IYW7_9BACT
MSQRIKLTVLCSLVVGIGLQGQVSARTEMRKIKEKAQVDSTVFKEQQISEVQITAKSKARALQEQAYAISVLDLQKSYTMNTPLNRLLNTVSSVRIREDGGVGSNYSFSMNGFTGNQVKFFLDGIPMDNFGSSFNLANLSANMAERVEVYKGVLPVYLGADALGGAVNILTRRNANYLDAVYSIGSFGTHKASVNGAYSNTQTGFTLRFNTFFNYAKNNYKVYAPIVDLNTQKVIGNEWVKRFHDQYRSGGLKVETGLMGRKWADYLLFGFIASGNNKNVQTGATMDAVYGGVKQRSFSFIPSVRYKKNDLWVDGLSLQLYATYNMVNTYNVDTLTARYNWLGQHVKSTGAGEAYKTDAKIREREWQANANINYMIDAHQSLTLNHVLTAMRRKAYDKAYPDDLMNNVPQILTKNVTGLGYQVRFDRWNASVFGKLYQLHSATNKLVNQFKQDQHWESVETDKTKLGFGVAATYFILPGLQAKVSYENAYRMPETVEMFGDGFIQKSNLNLKPESSKNLNAGFVYDRHIGVHHLMAEANYIYRRSTDFIMKGVSLTSNPTTAYTNLGKVITKGIEGSLRYEYKNIFHVGGTITYQDIKDRQEFIANEDSYVGSGISENISYGYRVPNIPYFFMNGGMGVNLYDCLHRGNKLYANYSTDYIYRYYLSFPGLGSSASKKVIPEQFSHNLSVGYAIQNGKYDISVECTNLTDKKLYDNYRLQKPGRAFSVKFRYYMSK